MSVERSRGGRIASTAFVMRFAGCTGVLVRTGKFQLAQIEKSEISPDAILDSLAGLPGLLGPRLPARPERSPNQKPGP